MVWGKSRQHLKQNAERPTTSIFDWAKDQGLKFGAAKTEIIFFEQLKARTIKTISNTIDKDGIKVLSDKAFLPKVQTKHLA